MSFIRGFWGICALIMLAVACGGDDNKSGGGSGRSSQELLQISENSNCSYRNNPPGNVDSWQKFQEAVARCDFASANPMAVTGDNNNYYGGGFYSGPGMAIYYYERCQYIDYGFNDNDPYFGGGFNNNNNNYYNMECYGEDQISVSFNMDNGRVRQVNGHPYGNNLNQIQERLTQLVANGTNHKRIGPTSFEFRSGGKTLQIDLSWPVTANPVRKIPTESSKNGYSLQGESAW